MTTYKLDETPDVYLSGVIKDGSYIFRMNHIEGESTNHFLRNIDLRKDKLIVYGTEINDSIRDKLHSSLIFRLDRGKLCVNCNGACYIFINSLSVYYRLIDNVVFDWSRFGVTVPNSVADLLIKQRQQKEDELAAVNKEEIEEVKKDKKVEIESYKEELNDLRNQLISSKKDNKYLEVELQMVQRQLSSTVFELLETSKIMGRVAKLEEQQGKVRNMEDRFYSIEKELQSTKNEQESMKKSVEGLHSLISSCRKENEDLFAKLQKVQNQSSSNNKIAYEKVQDHFTVIMNELQSVKNLMGFSAEMEVEFEN